MLDRMGLSELGHSRTWASDVSLKIPGRETRQTKDTSDSRAVLKGRMCGRPGATRPPLPWKDTRRVPGSGSFRSADERPF